MPEIDTSELLKKNITDQDIKNKNKFMIFW